MTDPAPPLSRRRRAAQRDALALEALRDKVSEMERVVRLYCGHDKMTDAEKVSALANHPLFACSLTKEPDHGQD